MRQAAVGSPFAWYCETCGKFDLASAVEPMAKPEHIPYRGVDIGSCAGKFEPLFSESQIRGTINELANTL